MICTPKTNFCRVFEVPNHFPDLFCFAGPIHVTFPMIDWFNPVPEHKQNEDWDTVVVPMLIDFIMQKSYVKLGRTYLVLTDWGASFTFQKNAEN